MNPELNILNHILKTKDIVTPLGADVEKSFILYRDEWNCIRDYYSSFLEVPPSSVVTDQFPQFEVYNTDGVIDHYIQELHKWKARHTLQEIITGAAAGLKDNGPFQTINSMQAQLATLGRDTRLIRDLDLIGNADERLDNFRERMELYASGKKLIGIPSGIKALDDAFGGWQKGDFVVIAGWTGSLKSWLALYFGINAWREGYRVLYISLEMSGLQVGYRFDTLLSGMDNERFTNTALTGGSEDITYDMYKTWLGEITRDKHPFIVVTNEDLDDVNQNTVLSKIEQWKPDLCILDYHSLFDDASGATGETEKVKNLSRAFKRIAIKTGVPIIDITGVTQDKKDLGTTPPELFDLAWSKQLAYDSDLTMGVCRQGDSLEVISRKVRRGRDFHFWLNWDIDKGIVRELSRSSIFAAQENDKDLEPDD